MEQEKRNSRTGRKCKMVGSERKKHALSLSTAHNTHIHDGIVRSREKSQGSAPHHIPREVQRSPVQAYSHSIHGTLWISAVSHAAGVLAGRRKPRVPPRPYTTAPVLCPPTNCSLHRHRRSTSQMILIIWQLLFIQQYFTLPSATSVISALQTLDTATVSMDYILITNFDALITIYS